MKLPIINEVAFNKEVKKVVDERANVLVEKLKRATPSEAIAKRWQYSGGAITNDANNITALNNGDSVKPASHFIERTLLSNEDVKPNGAIVALN